MQASNRWLALVALSGLTQGCGHGHTPSAATASQQPDHDSRVTIARSCAALKQRASGSPPAAVFVEVAHVRAPVSAPLREHLAEPVSVSHVAGIMLEPDRPASSPWGAAPQTLTVRWHEASSAPSELELEIDSDPSSRTTVRLDDQEPTLATRLQPGHEGAIVVTPYYLFAPKEESLQLLQRCRADHP